MSGAALSGARQGALSFLRRLTAAANARSLEAFVIPGPEVARAHGLDLPGAGLRLVPTPRHANVLLIVGPLPEGLRDAASVCWAQMPRPRALFSLGGGEITPLPAPDVEAELSQEGLIRGLSELARAFAAGAFAPQVEDYTAPALETRLLYTCPMHPEVVSDEPGSCPKCGMDLIPRETSASAAHGTHPTKESEPEMNRHEAPERPAAHETHDHAAHVSGQAGGATQYTCPMHPEVVSDEPGSCPKCGMHLVPVEEAGGGDHSGHTHHHGDHGKHADGEGPVQYTCPMHPEVVSDEPGSCPKCGMFLVPVEEAGVEDHSGHAHHHGDHAGHAGQGGHAGHGGGALAEGIEPHFMSMVELTRDLPRSSDGLQMEWITAPFGPFFPGLPGGLGLELTLDGDTVAGAHAGSLVAPAGPLVAAPTAPGAFTERLAAMMPLAPVSHALLAVRALEAAAGIEPDEALARGRAAALERERIASHLGWLASFGTHSGFVWLAEKAASLQLQARQADVEGLAALTPAITAFLRRLQRAPLLGMRLSGMARISPNAEATGPVLRASGRAEDARSEDPAATSLGFSPAVRAEGDALARLRLRCDEIIASLGLISAAGSLILPAAPEVGEATGEGAGLVETPRGAARLELRLEAGRVVEARLEAPSDRHLPLIEPLTGQQELGDALTAIVSLDLSPWEIRP